MTDHRNVFEALNAVMSEVSYVQKQRTPGLNYSYAGEAALIAEIRPALVKHGVVVYPSGIRDLRNESFTNKNGTQMNRTVGWFTFTFSHGATDTHFVTEVLGEGIDAGDKSSPKAMTGAYKYALRQTLMIETGDDPDSKASDDQERAAPAPRLASNPPQKAANSAPASTSQVSRPYDPETLKKGMEKNVLKSGKKGDATEKQKGAIVNKLNAFFMDREDPDDARHKLLNFFFGNGSSKALGSAQADVLFKWLESEYAQMEARAAVRHVEAGGANEAPPQSELDDWFDEQAA